MVRVGLDIEVDHGVEAGVLNRSLEAQGAAADAQGCRSTVSNRFSNLTGRSGGRADNEMEVLAGDVAAVDRRVKSTGSPTWRRTTCSEASTLPLSLNASRAHRTRGRMFAEPMSSSRSVSSTRRSISPAAGRSGPGFLLRHGGFVLPLGPLGVT